MTAVDSALPLPAGRPAAVFGLVATLRVVAERLTDTTLARGGQARDLSTTWSGIAATAADQELTRAGAASRGLAAALEAAVSVLNTYAATLDRTTTVIAGLRHQWEVSAQRHRRLVALAAADVTGLGDPGSSVTRAELDADWTHAQRELVARHTAEMRCLAEDGEAAAAALRACRSTPLMPGVPTGAAPAPSWGDSLARGLPMAVHYLLEPKAAAQVAAALSGRPPWSEWSTADVDGLLTLDTSNPAVAAALVSALGMDGITALTTRLARVPPGDHIARLRADEALATLGLGLRVALDQRSWGDDPRWASQAQDFNAAWMESMRNPTATSDGVTAYPITRVQVHTLLFSKSQSESERPLPPDVLVALARGGVTAEAGGQVWSAFSGSDPFLLVTTELNRDPGEAWRVLLREVDGHTTLLSYLVERRIQVAVDPASLVPCARALDQLMADVIDLSDDAAVRTTGEFVTSIAAATLASTADSRRAVDAYLTEFRPSLSRAFIAHPDVLVRTLAAAPRPGLATDGEDVGATRLVTVDGRTSFTLPHVASQRAVFGVLGSDGRGVQYEALGRGYLAEVITSTTNFQADSFTLALRSGDARSAEAAARGIGELVGFATAATSRGLIDRARAFDADAAATAALVKAALESIKVPAPLKRNWAGLLASLVVDQLTKVDPATIFPSLRTDAAETSRVIGGKQRAEVEDLLRRLAADAVSAEASFAPGASPRDWVAAHPGVDFTDSHGRPLPIAEMTGPQYDRFSVWAQSTVDYRAIGDSIVAGYRSGLDRVELDQPLINR